MLSVLGEVEVQSRFYQSYICSVEPWSQIKVTHDCFQFNTMEIFECEAHPLSLTEILTCFTKLEV